MAIAETKICTCRLHTAGIVIAWISAIISLVQAVRSLIGLARAAELADVFKSDPKLEVLADTELTVVFSLELCFSILHFFASVLLFIGTKRNSHLLLLPWLIDLTLSLVYQLYFMGKVLKASSDPVWLVIFIPFVITVWLWIAIYSLFKHIRCVREEANDIERRPFCANPELVAVEYSISLLKNKPKEGETAKDKPINV